MGKGGLVMYGVRIVDGSCWELDGGRAKRSADKPGRYPNSGSAEAKLGSGRDMTRGVEWELWSRQGLRQGSILARCMSQ
jgi:hypothetical protein